MKTLKFAFKINWPLQKRTANLNFRICFQNISLRVLQQENFINKEFISQFAVRRPVKFSEKPWRRQKCSQKKKELWHTDTRYELSRYFCSHKISCEPHWAKKWSNLSKLDWKHCELYSQRVTKTCLNLSKLV